MPSVMMKFLFIDLFGFKIVRDCQCWQAICLEVLWSLRQHLVCFVSFRETPAHLDLTFAAIVNVIFVFGDLSFFGAIQACMIRVHFTVIGFDHDCIGDLQLSLSLLHNIGMEKSRTAAVLFCRIDLS